MAWEVGPGYLALVSRPIRRGQDSIAHTFLSPPFRPTRPLPTNSLRIQPGCGVGQYRTWHRTVAFEPTRHDCTGYSLATA
eukprot:1241923-Rhodomonas_salina.1